MKRIAIGQINTTIGDFEGNLSRIVEYAREAAREGAQLICFPELALCGYPPQDLVEIPSFVESNRRALEGLADRVDGIDVLVGHVEPNRRDVGKPVHNAASLVRGGEIAATFSKSLLPTYDVFNEARYFEPASRADFLPGPGQVGVTICEDIWNDPEFPGTFNQPRYERNPLEELRENGAEVVLNLAASPFVRGKDRFRHEMYSRLAEKYGVTLVACNLVGGNDALVFDGNSMVFNDRGELLASARSFEEDLLVVDLQGEPRDFEPPGEVETVFRTLTLGLSDYFKKCGVSRGVVGKSGGIDSSMTAAVANEAIGAMNVLGVMMPSEISSEASLTDAEKLADNLSIETRIFPIQEVFESYLGLFEEEFAGLGWDTTEENLQARVRGNILMALSNKYGHIVLSTGNKSELAVGYCTLYGDMTGGIGVLSDVPKTTVYELARWVNRNREGEIIPESVIEKPPSAELAPDQRDQDELPPYELLDRVIERYVERRQSRRQIVESGFDPDLVDDVIGRIDANEYKRQQAPLGLKVTSRALGAGRVMPIAHRFHHGSED